MRAYKLGAFGSEREPCRQRGPPALLAIRLRGVTGPRHATPRGRLGKADQPGLVRAAAAEAPAPRTRRGLPSSGRPRSGLKAAAGHAITAGPRSASPASRRGASGPLLTMARAGVSGLEQRERPGAAQPNPGPPRRLGRSGCGERTGCLEASGC